jgi:hypothetical protein
VDISIEASFIKVVYECIVKTFKSNKKYIEKELSGIVNKITQTKKSAAAGAMATVSTLDQLVAKLNSLKIKVCHWLSQ